MSNDDREHYEMVANDMLNNSIAKFIYDTGKRQQSKCHHKNDISNDSRAWNCGKKTCQIVTEEAKDIQNNSTANDTVANDWPNDSTANCTIVSDMFKDGTANDTRK